MGPVRLVVSVSAGISYRHWFKSPLLHSQSSSLLKEKQWGMAQIFIPLPPCGRTARSSWLLISNQFSSSLYSHLGSESTCIFSTFKKVCLLNSLPPLQLGTSANRFDIPGIPSNSPIKCKINLLSPTKS